MDDFATPYHWDDLFGQLDMRLPIQIRIILKQQIQQFEGYFIGNSTKLLREHFEMGIVGVAILAHNLLKWATVKEKE